MFSQFTESFVLSYGIYLTWFDVFGMFAVAFAFLAFFTKEKQMMRLYGIVSTAFFGVVIYFYGGINGLFVSMVSILIKLLSLSFEEMDIKFLQRLTPLIAVIFFFFFNSEGLIGILPAISLIFIAIADTQENIYKMKLWYFGSAFCWFFYAVILNSVPQ